MTSDQEQPKRRFRFSLITLLVAVNVAGVLVWANLVHRNDVILVDRESMPAFVQGWPATAMRARPNPTRRARRADETLGTAEDPDDGAPTTRTWSTAVREGAPPRRQKRDFARIVLNGSKQQWAKRLKPPLTKHT